jgi:hypothetical protein
MEAFLISALAFNYSGVLQWLIIAPEMPQLFIDKCNVKRANLGTTVADLAHLIAHFVIKPTDHSASPTSPP